MIYGQRVSNWFKVKVWKYVKDYPLRVLASVAGGMILGSSPFVFSVERLLLKTRIHFGLFIPNDEKFQDGKFKETSSSVQLREILSPQAKANSYFMITGEHGIGKSSASTHGADMLGHQGIVYVRVPESGDPQEFEKSLAQRLFLYHLVYDKFFSYLSLFTGLIVLDFPDYDGDKKASYLTVLMNKLSVLSRQYKRWHDGKGLVLVIDQVNHFLKKGENGKYYLDVLQDKAKSLADDKLIKIVFISSEGEAFARMMNRSALSRAHVIEFHEASDQEALEFLADRLGEEEFNKKKNELLDLVQSYTGGKFKTLADVVEAKDNLKGKKAELHGIAVKHFQAFLMHRDDKELQERENDEKKKPEERQKASKALVMKKIGNHIVKHGKIDRGLLTGMILGTMGEEELRRTNVFAYHHSTNCYSFSTRALMTVYKEMASSEKDRS